MSDWDLGICIATIAIMISIIAAMWNYRHSESLFHRQEYPAVLWHEPEVSKKGDATALKTYICNKGPREITSVFLGLFLCRGFKKKAWRKSKELEIPIGEKLNFVITEELEEDIRERFGGLCQTDAWRFNGKPRRYKAIVRLEYLPLIAGVKYLVRKGYYLITPVMGNDKIKSWELKQLPNWQGSLPWF